LYDDETTERKIPLDPEGERERCMELGLFALPIDKRDEPFNILIRHAGDFPFVVNRKQCYLNGVIIMPISTFIRIPLLAVR
jgi:hypothetical protein